eukprot:CAMPEP_0167756834 /NCGR_PEP_ID=MMETSP0110_2-20121227/9599_1 /TAXON_ID=629695 /ORGANISM="Gymnochlora sp., Strain CCMP2014" /LENGTH=473 /DNA_ID=CAMNT_0007642975 /DNA_START=101 /DNA_END=1522 /DNA_ORIENTATION=-
METAAWRSAGIVCTLGPGSDKVDMMQKLIEAGLDVARFNFSHGSHEYHGKLMDNVRKAAVNAGKMVALALDTKGPEIRTGKFVKDEYELKKGSKVIVTVDEKFKDAGTDEKFWVTYSDLPNSVAVGSTIFIDDGLLALKVFKKTDMDVHCVIENGGLISNRKGVNLPGAKVTLPALSAKDKADIAFGVEKKVDMIFASFIRKKEDVLQIKKLIPKSVLVISKIENQEGCDNFEDILSVSDGIMVARGDLGIEIDATKVFVQQKRMIRLCRRAAKPVIVATQMLQSMVTNPRPTRAEVSDVANAILDGADCVMLSGETAKGKYPVEAVQQMAKTCQIAEDNLALPPVKQESYSMRETCVRVACSMAKEQNAKAIVAVTNTGTTARYISRHRPVCPILAVIGETNSHIARHLQITFGAHVALYDDAKGKPTAVKRIEAAIHSQKGSLLKKGDLVVCLYSADHSGFANIIEMRSVE